MARCPLFAWLAVALPCTIALAQPPAQDGPAPVESQRADAPEPDKPDPAAGVAIAELALRGRIDGSNITFDMSFTVKTDRPHREIPLLVGDVVLDKLIGPKAGHKLRYDIEQQTYYLGLPNKGEHTVRATFAARARASADGQWRTSTFDVPGAMVRRIQIDCDRADLEVELSHAMRIEREVNDDTLTISGILGPGKPFKLRWKPQVQPLDAKLVASAEANIIATVDTGALKLDELVMVHVSQGELSELTFALPELLSVTQVRGPFIRDWQVTGEGADRVLKVVLNRPQDSRYALRIVGEAPLGKFPAQLSLPVAEPTGGLRTRGHLLIGTNSAIALVVDQTTGLSQIDHAGFPRVERDRNTPRPLPSAKAFAYGFAGMPIAMSVSIDDIVPSFDAAHRLVATVKEDDLIVEGQVELDVRDAPVRTLTMDVPGRFNVAAVQGAALADYRVTGGEDGPKRIELQFTQPVLGTTVIALRLELGRSPLDEDQTITGPSISGAKTQRGYLVVVVDQGLRIVSHAVADEEKLKAVHTGSVPMRVADAELAYRFRSADWGLNLNVARRPAGVRAELFHLTSIGEGIAYGSVAANYFITGSPIDRLRFVIPAELGNVEFIGRDVAGWSNEGGVWTVRLRRKVIGDYNLAVTFHQRYHDGEAIRIGAVACDGVQVQSGYVLVASHMNLKLSDQGEREALLPIEREEVPPNYRLLVHAPILRSYKYVQTPHAGTLELALYERGELLPVVVEIMELRTELDVRDAGETESITRVTYKVKNASSQYLSVLLPTGADFRRVHRAAMNADGTLTAPVKVAVSHDDQTGALLIPLQRNANPNEPVTLTLEYAQEHGTLGFAGALALTAPGGDVPATFADWLVKVPDDWAVRPAGGAMAVASESVEPLDLAWFGRRVAEAWGQALHHNWLPAALGLGALGGLGLVVLTWLAFRPATWFVALAVVLAGAVLLGAGATRTHAFAGELASPPHGGQVQFKQAVNVQDAEPLDVVVSIVPTWREHVTLIGAIVAPIMGLLLLAAAVWLRRARVVLGAAGGVGLVMGAAQFEPAVLPLGHLLTWGLPTLLLAAVLVKLGARVVAHQSARRVVAAAALLGAMLLAAGCLPQRITYTPIADQPLIESLAVELTAESDSMLVDMDLKISATGAARFPLLDATAVLLSDAEPADHLSIERDDRQYFVVVDHEGEYAVKLRFVTPLAKPDDNQVRRYVLPMPIALTNRVTLAIDDDDVEVNATDAVRMADQSQAGLTTAAAVFAPGQPAQFTWKPRARQRELERTVFYGQVTSAMRFDSGAVEGRHDLALQVAQGEVRQIRVKVPANMTVTAVHGAELGAWRFEPADQELVAVLSTPATGEYRLHVVTHTPIESLPVEATLGRLTLVDAARQRGAMGLLTSDAVYIELTEKPQAMNVDDFRRDAQSLLANQSQEAQPIRHAFRIRSADDRVVASVHEVRSEIRAIEQASFSVADDHLVYNGQIALQIAKAGRFSADLRLPASYDIDALTAEGVSHWDESVADGVRHVQVHFKQKLLGRVALHLAMRQPVSQMAERITVPRVEVDGAVKHTGRIVVSSARGVRLNVVERDGVSELPAEHDRAQQTTALVYRLLRPDWRLVVATEVIQPLVDVEFLHAADVSEGMVRHTNVLRYELHNAGLKVFEVQVPDGVLGLVFEGQQIARRQRVGPGRHRIELSGKWFDRPYFLTIRYETQYDRADGRIEMQPVRALDADHQRGFVVVNKTDRVRVSADRVGPALTPTDARSIRGFAGSPDLSGAAFAWRSTAAAFDLALLAQRLEARPQLEANVLSTHLATVVTERGESINHLRMQLRVGAKRYLRTQLPDRSRVWTLLVNGRAVAPSRGKAPGGHDVLLIPLAQAALGELPVQVDLIYVRTQNISDWAGRRTFQGPRFDLPLKELRWAVYVPRTYEYNDFEGTLTVVEDLVEQHKLLDYDARQYIANVQQAQSEDKDRARQLQRLGERLAVEGKQYQARQALELGWNYSQSDAALNEDIRVDLHNLRRQQAKVGLYGSRARLRQQGDDAANQGPAPLAVGDAYDAQTAQRIEADLNEAEDVNLDTITTRIIEIQESATVSAAQLSIDMPLRGRVLEFRRPLQVNDYAQMSVSFDASRKVAPRAAATGAWAGGVFVVFALALGMVTLVARHGWCETPAPRADEPIVRDETERPDSDDEDRLEPPTL